MFEFTKGGLLIWNPKGINNVKNLIGMFTAFDILYVKSNLSLSAQKNFNKFFGFGKEAKKKRSI